MQSVSFFFSKIDDKYAGQRARPDGRDGNRIEALKVAKILLHGDDDPDLSHLPMDAQESFRTLMKMKREDETPPSWMHGLEHAKICNGFEDCYKKTMDMYKVIRVKAGQRTGLGLVVYANSITLTPGTVSIDIEGDTIVVHALTREAAEGVESGVMDQKVTALEGSH